MPAFGSAVVEVAIGLAFMYLLLSLVLTVVNELIAQAFALRARTLEEGLVQLLQGKDVPTGNLLQRLWNVVTHRRVAVERPQGVPTAAAILNHPLIQSLSPRGGGTPSNIPAREFALALLSIVAHDLDSSDPDYVAKLRQAISGIEGHDHTRDVLLALIDKSSQDVDDVRARLESWFNDAMDRVTGWYKRKITIIGLVVGFVLTALVNADSLGVAQSLWTTPSTRSAVASAAQDFVSKQPTPAPAPTGQPAPTAPAGATPTPRPLQTEGKGLSEDIASIESSQLPLGWRVFPPLTVVDGFRELTGLLLTTLAISLGAPFWFDFLSLFVQVKTSGPVSSSSSNSPATTPSSGVAKRMAPTLTLPVQPEPVRGNGANAPGGT